MSKLDEIVNKHVSKLDPIEKCIGYAAVNVGVSTAEQAADELAALQTDNAALREAVNTASVVLSLYANENNWKSINGIMTMQTMSHPWSDAKMAHDKLTEALKAGAK